MSDPKAIIIPTAQNILDQLEEIFLVTDESSRFIQANQHTAKLFGYKDVDAMLGVDAYGMRCPASESAQNFIEQDKQVIQHKKPISILDIHTYADDRVRILLTKKSPIYDDEKNVRGVLCHCREIVNTTFQNMGLKIAQADQQFYSKNQQHDRSYQIAPEHDQLSKRELEILFFMLRGKTMVQIGELLFISKRTVENHIANIKSKLNCNKKSEIIEYGLRQGYMNLIPESLLRKDISVLLDDVS